MCTILRLFLFTCTLSLTEAIKNHRHPGKKLQFKNPEGECILDRSNVNAYRGNVSVTLNGERCLPWYYVHNRRYTNCYHNYCRSHMAANMAQPWCFVRKGNNYVRKYCDIQIKPTPEPPKQDTESTCGERHLEPMTKIIGGLRSNVETQPWIAAVFKGNGFICGGTLIAPCWVLTAAHCFPSGNNTQTKRYSVILGKNAINETNPVKEQRFEVSKIVIHENYDYITENFNNDIALLKIKNSNGQCAVKTNSVRTACLPPFQQMLAKGFHCEIAGYGRHQKGGFEYSRHLKKAQVELISQDACQDKYYSKDAVNENMLCAVGKGWEDDACKGDSGGPLVCEVNDTMFLFGIISWGIDCAEKFKPGVYTKVSNYNNWISMHTGLPTYTAGSRYPQKD
ncbi:plasminogen activator, urokinase a [Pseudorasbora parva]|uniref:plasminogen activator, urokinase a n=1 Tax=Pseudorasbora parva TaxID=51549 RepID=UPI00351E9597